MNFKTGGLNETDGGILNDIVKVREANVNDEDILKHQLMRISNLIQVPEVIGHRLIILQLLHKFEDIIDIGQQWLQWVDDQANMGALDDDEQPHVRAIYSELPSVYRTMVKAHMSLNQFGEARLKFLQLEVQVGARADYVWYYLLRVQLGTATKSGAIQALIISLWRELRGNRNLLAMKAWTRSVLHYIVFGMLPS